MPLILKTVDKDHDLGKAVIIIDKIAEYSSQKNAASARESIRGFGSAHVK